MEPFRQLCVRVASPSDHSSLVGVQVIQTILDCSVEVATKCGIYATLVGVLFVTYCTDTYVAAN